MELRRFHRIATVLFSLYYFPPSLSAGTIFPSLSSPPSSLLSSLHLSPPLSLTLPCRIPALGVCCWSAVRDTEALLSHREQWPTLTSPRQPATATATLCSHVALISLWLIPASAQLHSIQCYFHFTLIRLRRQSISYM